MVQSQIVDDLDQPGLGPAGRVHLFESYQEGILDDVAGIVGRQTVSPDRAADEREEELPVERIGFPKRWFDLRSLWPRSLDAVRVSDPLSCSFDRPRHNLSQRGRRSLDSKETCRSGCARTWPAG